jgi:hypothetical protein
MGRNSNPAGGKRFSLLLICPHQSSGTPSLHSNKQWGFFPGVTEAGHGTDHSPNLAPTIGMSGAIPLLPLCTLMACYGETLAFTLLLSLLLQMKIKMMMKGMFL